EDLAAVLGDADRVLELRRETLVPRHRRPAVAEELHRRLAEVDHRLDSHEHAGPELGPGAGARGMDHFGRIVEQAAETVPAEIAHYAVAVLFGMGLDRRADVAEARAWPDLRDPDHQALVGHLDQPTSLQRHVADEVHAARIPVPAVEQRGHVDIDDVTLAQRLRRGNPVADDMVDRNAARMRIAAIAERRRHPAAVESHLAHDAIDL